MSEHDYLAELAADLAGVAADETRRIGIAALLDAVTSRPGDRPEDRLLDLGFVDERALAIALAARSGRRFEGLRGFEPDPRLFLYVPLALAERERIVPLLIVADTLTIASAYLDPDLSAVVERFPNLRLELVVSPRAEIVGAVRRVRL